MNYKCKSSLLIKLVIISMLIVIVTQTAYISEGRLNNIARINVSPLASSYYNGVVYSTSTFTVGINDFGVMGIVADGTDVGFQYPPGSNYESIAVGWWVDGWSIFYNTSSGDKSGGFSPDDGDWGVINGVAPNTIYLSDKAISVIITNDDMVNITIKTIISSSYNGILQEITITNIGDETIRNVEFKKITDWDVWEPLVGSFSNYWGIDEIRLPGYYLAVAFVNESIAPGTVYMGTAVSPAPNGIDLNWNDHYSRGLSSPVVKYISEDGTTSLYIDGAVVYDWLFGDLDPGQSVTIYVAHSASDDLTGLENNIKELIPTPVVGGIIVFSNYSDVGIPAFVTLLIVAFAVAASIYIYKKK